MRRALIGALVIGAVAVALMLWLLATRRIPPPVPADAAHAASRSEADCVVCHGPDGAAPRSKRHPLSDRCFQCHEWASSR
jgi:cytochrome c553